MMGSAAMKWDMHYAEMEHGTLSMPRDPLYPSSRSPEERMHGASVACRSSDHLICSTQVD